MSKESVSIEQRAHAYKERAYARFKRSHKCGSDQCEFCAGWTWGAVDGYKAGVRAATRKGK